jgi:trigger factor
MNITRENVDALNAIVKVSITKDDYKTNVDKALYNYRKTASIPGFRKGVVPVSLIQKQYGKQVLLEEVNKLLQTSLSSYMSREKLNILGNPLPKINEDFNWDTEDFVFEFELGLAPEFTVDITAPTNIVKYTITADDAMLDEQIVRIQKQYGKLVSKDTVEAGDDVAGTFKNEEKGIDNPGTISADIFADAATFDKFIGKKVGDVVSLSTKGLFDDDHKLMDYLKISHDDVHGFDADVDFVIEEINTTEPAELNQELFDKLFGEGAVTSIDEVKAKIKEDAEQQFVQQADQKFLNDATESLIHNTKFDLPEAFLVRWLQTVGEKQLTPEEAEAEYKKSENGLRYQLIEGKVMADNNLQITFEDLKSYTKEVIKKQMAQFGQLEPTEADVDGIVARVLGNQEEVKRLSDQVMSEKMVNLFKEKVPHTTKEVTYQEFIKEMYGE